LAEGGRDGEVRYLGEIDATESARADGLSRSRAPERSTRDTVKRGGSTKAGNGRARRVASSLQLTLHAFPVRRRQKWRPRRRPREIIWKARVRLTGLRTATAIARCTIHPVSNFTPVSVEQDYRIHCA